MLPNGTGQVNEAGLDFYDRLVDCVLEAGIRPFATVYHWDLPQALQDRGGWPARDTAYALAEFAGVVAARLGDRVSDWHTINEPLCSAWIGHLEGRMAPGERDLDRAVARLAPPAARARPGRPGAARSRRRGPLRIGAVVNLSRLRAGQRPARGRRRRPARRRPHQPVVAGPALRPRLPDRHGRASTASSRRCSDGDLDIIAAPMEHIGLNYYFRQVVTRPTRPARCRTPRW